MAQFEYEMEIVRDKWNFKHCMKPLWENTLVLINLYIVNYMTKTPTWKSIRIRLQRVKSVIIQC